jgi:uncharacterized protein (UPF0332 family)
VLVYVSRLSQEEAAAIFNVANVFQNNQLRSQLLLAVKEVVQDRLTRAAGCLALAERLRANADHESMRAAVNRAYYSAHHSIRAMILCKKNSDPDEHSASVKAFENLLGEAKFAKRSGLNASIIKDVWTAMTNRHVADYSPYDESRKDLAWMPITDADWAKAAEFNIKLAKKLLAAAQKVV